MARITKTPAADPSIAQAVTAHQPFRLGGTVQLFAVQPGVPLSDALDTLSILVGTAGAAVADMAMAIGERNEPEAPWAIAHLLDAAHALTASIHTGFNQARGVGSAHVSTTVRA